MATKLRFAKCKYFLLRWLSFRNLWNYPFTFRYRSPKREFCKEKNRWLKPKALCAGRVFKRKEEWVFSVPIISLQHLPFSVITVEFNAASNTYERKTTNSKDEVTVGGAASCQVSISWSKSRAVNRSSRNFAVLGEVPTRPFFWLKDFCAKSCWQIYLSWVVWCILCFRETQVDLW